MMSIDASTNVEPIYPQQFTHTKASSCVEIFLLCVGVTIHNKSSRRMNTDKPISLSLDQTSTCNQTKLTFSLTLASRIVTKVFLLLFPKVLALHFKLPSLTKGSAN